MVQFNSALRNKIWYKMFVHGINRKIFGVVHPLCAHAGNLSLKTPILVGLIIKW